MIWQIPQAEELFDESPQNPIGQYKGHEGKNIWSVAVSPGDTSIVSTIIVVHPLPQSQSRLC